MIEIAADEVNISLGSYKVTSTPSGYKRLISFYKDCRKLKDKIISIDFSSLEWFDANLSAILFSMLYTLSRENGLKFVIDLKLIEEKFDILMRNGFIDSDIVVGKSNRTCVRLQAFDSTDESEFVKYVTDDLFSNDALSQMNEKTKERMILNLLEIFANVGHARTSHPIFACGQYYPAIKRLKFTLVDLGVGFLKPICEFTKGQVKTPKDAIEWALKEGASTKTDVTGGFGLSDIHKYCGESDSHVSIMTDGIIWGTDLGRIGSYSTDRIEGSVITLDFNCN